MNQPNTSQLWPTIWAFTQADDSSELQRLVSEHPELLTDAADALLGQMVDDARARNSQEHERRFAERRTLLSRCRQVGIEQAFSSKIRGQSSEKGIPPGFEVDMAEARRLEAQKQWDPRVIGRLIQVYERILKRLPLGQHLVFRATVQRHLGLAYANLPKGDRGKNLAQAIECWKLALHIFTAQATPHEYATLQHFLGCAYADLPTGAREANLMRAIECWELALHFWTPSAAPHEYAIVQYNLGLAYMNLPTGDRSANLAQAIECYQNALRFWTEEVAPSNYAMTQRDLGNAYAQLPTRDREASLMQAIKCYQEALRFHTPQTVPFEYAMTQHNLGNAYAQLPTKNRGANLAQAIECYQQALRFHTPQTVPFEYASIQHNLGNVYAQLPTGDHGTNLAQAISCYQQALRFRTPETMPFKYAQTLNSLGNVYLNLPTGNRQVNLEQAISCYQEALRFRTFTAAPRAYALTQNNLGNAVANLPTGNREANLAQAEACYREALRVYTLETAPFEYAETQNNLGNVYSKFPTGKPEANLEQAIKCFQEALRIYTPQSAPYRYAATQNNLGNAYIDLSTGDREQNLRRAMTCYQEALRFCTPEAMPREYAESQTNLGIAYTLLPTGDREANNVQAIKCYQAALRVYTAQSTPLEYARTQNQLGNAYAQLPTGDRAANLKEAIKCYEEALHFWTPSSDPLNYAMTQNNLGVAVTKLPTGNRGANLTRAIECYHEALRFRTASAAPYEYAETQANLGIAYFYLPRGNRAANLQKAIKCYQEALRFRTPSSVPFDYAMTQNNLSNVYRYLPTGDRGANLQQAIKCCQEALGVWTAESAPLDYAMAQENLGLAYSSLPSDQEANNVAAIRCYQEALRFWTPDTAPHDCRETNFLLANLYLGQREWDSALAAYHAAMDAGERLYRAGLSTESKATEIRQNAFLYHNAAFAAARQGKTEEALLILERGKTRLLTEALRLRIARPAGVPDEVWTAFEQAGSEVRTVQSEDVALSGQERIVDPVASVAAYEARVERARAASTALETAIRRVRLYAPNFLCEIDRRAIDALIPDEDTALVAFCVTDQGSMGFAYTKHHQAVQMVDVPGFRRRDWQRLLIELDAENQPIGGWLMDYGRYQEERTQTALDAWQATMTCTLKEVGQYLLAPILNALPPDIKRVILLPSGGLFVLPLHAAPLSNNGTQRVCDRYQVSYAPSAEVLSDLRAKATQTAGNGLLAVINPEEDPELPFTPAEGMAISSLFAEHEVLMRAGTKEAVEGGVRERAYLHFACHGTYNWDEPPASALTLADAQLTLAELQSGKVDMSSARLVTLSACETGMTDIIKGSPEEYVGLPAGFMLAGVPCVVASLWAVPDISTALLMERFYHNHRKGGMDFVTALHEAQKWVRELPIGEVAKYAEKCLRQAKRKDQAQLLIHKNHYAHRAQQNPNERPFAHPYYWAAFTVNGM